MCAFVTTTFTLWMRCVDGFPSWPLSRTFRNGPINRNFELHALHTCHVTGDFMQPPYNLPHLHLGIVNRKTRCTRSTNRTSMRSTCTIMCMPGESFLNRSWAACWKTMMTCFHMLPRMASLTLTVPCHILILTLGLIQSSNVFCSKWFNG